MFNIKSQTAQSALTEWVAITVRHEATRLKVATDNFTKKLSELDAEKRALAAFSAGVFNSAGNVSSTLDINEVISQMKALSPDVKGALKWASGAINELNSLQISTGVKAALVEQFGSDDEEDNDERDAA